MADGSTGFDLVPSISKGAPLNIRFSGGQDGGHLQIATNTGAVFGVGRAIQDILAGAPAPSTSVGRLLDQPHAERGYRFLTSPIDQGPSAQVYDRRAALKVATAEIAMHLDQAWRTGLFRSLDELMEVDEWDFSDELPTDASYRTFLRMIIFLGPIRRPALGATSNGNIVAGWMHDRDRLVVECEPGDEVRWSVSKWRPDRESASGRTTVERLPSVLSPYDSSSWLSVAVR